MSDVMEMEILDPTGHVTVRWDPDDKAEVATARQTFDEMTKKGYQAFRRGEKKGERGERLTTFDPKAKRVLLFPQLQGG
jgi:hypothetical protein